MGFETLVLAREESYAIVTLNRPPANAISEPLIHELNDALNAVRDDDSVRSVIITGRATRSSAAAPTSARRSPAVTSRPSSASATA